MISGFNTDVEFSGTVYHVQTEDKGLSTQMIISLVYNGGTIIASKRASYDDLLIGNFDEKLLAERVGRQHKLICAAIRAGRIDELKGMSAKLGTSRPKSKRAPVETAAIPAAVTTPAPSIEGGVARTPIKISIVEQSSNPFAEIPVIDPVRVIEDNILPADAVAVVSELSGKGPSAGNKLIVKFIGDSKFKGGDRKTVNIIICRGHPQNVVDDAQIMVKVLGSSFRPIIFHAKSDSNGIARVHLQLPHFTTGRAAILVRAISNGEEVELRRIIAPG